MPGDGSGGGFSEPKLLFAEEDGGGLAAPGGGVGFGNITLMPAGGGVGFCSL